MKTKRISVAKRHAVVFVIVAALTTACSTPNLSVAPVSRVELSGRWFLDRDASDDTVQTVRASIKKRKSIDHQRRGNPANGALAASNFSAETLDGLREALPPDDADWLDIRQTRTEVSLDYEDLKKARYRSGQKLTVFDGAGTGVLIAGWDIDRFVIYNDYDGGFTLWQTFEIERNTERLTQTIEIKSGRLKNKVIIRRYYDSKKKSGAS